MHRLTLAVAFVAFVAFGCTKVPSAAALPDVAEPPIAAPLPTQGPEAGSSKSTEHRVRLDPEVDAILEQFNRWCGSRTDSCQLAFHPEYDPDATPDPDAMAKVHDARHSLGALGHDVTWTTRAVLRAENDIQIVVGGHFSVAHIGPEQHEGIKRRIRAAPTAYLDVFEARILPLATHPRLSTWFPMTFLELVDPDEADRLCRISEELVGRYEAVLDARLSDPRDENWRHRMEQRHDMLAQFASRVCGR